MLQEALEFDALVNTQSFGTFNLFSPCVLIVFFMQFASLYVGKSLVLLFTWHTKKCTYI